MFCVEPVELGPVGVHHEGFLGAGARAALNCGYPVRLRLRIIRYLDRTDDISRVAGNGQAEVGQVEIDVDQGTGTEAGA